MNQVGSGFCLGFGESLHSVAPPDGHPQVRLNVFAIQRIDSRSAKISNRYGKIRVREDGRRDGASDLRPYRDPSQLAKSALWPVLQT
jgi:hypothetical protein